MLEAVPRNADVANTPITGLYQIETSSFFTPDDFIDDSIFSLQPWANPRSFGHITFPGFTTNSIDLD